MTKRLLIIAHVPSPNTKALSDAAARGAGHPDITGIELDLRTPFETQPEHVKAANAVLLGTTENLGYMSGALKDFFDRCYYPCMEACEGMPYALYIRAGLDGTGTKRAVTSIAGGMKWKLVAEPLILHGTWDEKFTGQVEELATTLAAGLEAGIF